jgi:hypothetical protein
MTREASGLSERLGCTHCPFEDFLPTTALYLEASSGGRWWLGG